MCDKKCYRLYTMTGQQKHDTYMARHTCKIWVLQYKKWIVSGETKKKLNCELWSSYYHKKEGTLSSDFFLLVNRKSISYHYQPSLSAIHMCYHKNSVSNRVLETLFFHFTYKFLAADPFFRGSIWRDVDNFQSLYFFDYLINSICTFSKMSGLVPPVLRWQNLPKNLIFNH